MERLVDEKEFENYKKTQGRAQKDIFFIWLLIILISVIAAHFVLNIAGGSPTGFVTASENPDANVSLLLGSLQVVFICVLITAVVYIGITQKDY